MAKRELITDGTFRGFLIEVLTIEWVPCSIGLAMSHVPPIVPVVGSKGLPSLDFTNLRINERL